MTEIIAEKNSQVIWVKRQFNANKNLVFRLFSEKELQLKWQSAFLQDFNFQEFNCTSGGSYKSTHIGPDGQTYGFKGVFHEITLDEKIIKTSEFLGLPFKVSPTLEILSFEQNNLKTLLTIQIICDSETTRDAMVQHGMEAHFNAIFGKMDTLISE